MSNTYASLNEFKDGGAITIGDPLIASTNDRRMLQLLEDVSRQFDDLCKRVFFSYTVTKTFDGNGRKRLYLPDDLIAIATFKEDEDNDAVYEITWPNTDYILWPDIDPTDNKSRARPYLRIDVDERSSGNQDFFMPGQRRYELAGRWGYSESKVSLTTVASGLDADATITTFELASEVLASIGDTLIIEDEQLYVTEKEGTTLTVERGVNGTTGATHPDATAISRRTYPGPITEAVIMQTARLWTRRGSGFASTVGFDEAGQMQVQRGLDPDVKEQVRPYVKLFA